MTDPRAYEQEYQGGLASTRLALERFLKEDGKNVFDPKKIWKDKPNISGPGVNELLDQGAVGLEWFRLALVRYHRVGEVVKLPGFDRIDVPAVPVGGGTIPVQPIDTTADPNKTMIALEGRYYDQQRSMNLDSLRKLSTEITGAALGAGDRAGVVDITGDLAGVAGAVPEAWQGQGGTAAQDHLAGFHAHADQQAQYLQAVAAALFGLPDVLLQIVRDKASFVAGFDSPQCPVAGHAMRIGDGDDPVSVIITVAAGKAGNLFRDDKATVRDQLHLENRDQAEQASKDWLSNHFGPAVREAFTAFIHQCVLADYYIRQAYKPVTDLLDNHDSTPFPKPQDRPDPRPQYQPTGTATSPASVTTPSVDAAVPPSSQVLQQAPALTTPAGVQSDPLQTLTGLAGQAGQAVTGLAGQAAQTVQQGVDQVESAVQNGLGGLTGVGASLPDSAESSGVRPLASFPLGGGNLALAQTRDGAVAATFTGPDGKRQQYTLGIKDGAPYLTRSEDPSATAGASHAPAITDPRKGSGSAGVGGSSGRPSPPTQVGASSEHTPPISVPATASGTPTSSSSVTPAQAATGSTPSGMPMGGMPPGGGASAGKGAPDGERRSTGIVPPKPLWNTLPGREGPVLDASAVPEPAAAENFYGDPGTTPPPTALRPEPPPAPRPEPAPSAPRRDGVKIEIDMGDQR
ncbi:hypothetical protein [Nocardia terpenica]|uniref:Uncharacterized protein n=1 Tax=Nocardia terpenica TaxID=455432 RepID=A0A6G9YZ44_9NOCA|nr:hypothetical protein [Nocardia terpenica]QIS18256.1 hypothetical protein F6W96_08165 [Nocardia terpenica]